jgi:hypothetical protein
LTVPAYSRISSRQLSLSPFANFFSHIASEILKPSVFHDIHLIMDEYVRDRFSQLVISARQTLADSKQSLEPPRRARSGERTQQTKQAIAAVVAQGLLCAANGAFRGRDELSFDAQECFNALDALLLSHYAEEPYSITNRAAAIKLLMSSAGERQSRYQVVGSLADELNATGAVVFFDDQSAGALALACRDLAWRLKKLLNDTYPIFRNAGLDGTLLEASPAVREATRRLHEVTSRKRELLIRHRFLLSKLTLAIFKVFEPRKISPSCSGRPHPRQNQIGVSA